MSCVVSRITPTHTEELDPDAKQSPTHTQFQKASRPPQPTWPWQVHLVGLCSGKIHRRNVGPIGRDFPTSFSVRTFREAPVQAHLSRTDHSRHNQKQWHFAELLVAVAAAASVDVVDFLRVEVCSTLRALQDFSANAQ
jgi:hypothetical protein